MSNEFSSVVEQADSLLIHRFCNFNLSILHLKIYFFEYEEIVELKNYCSGVLACIASVSVWFRSKERPRNGIFGFSRAKKGTRTKNPFFERSLTLVPCSLLRNRTETLATRANRRSVTKHSTVWSR